MSGAIVCKAATRYVRKRVGSFSPSSSDSQAVGRSIPSTHSLTSVVFPKPAGAEMRVRLRCRPSCSRSSRRGRLTTFGRSRGRYSFVARMGVTFSLLQLLPRPFFPPPNGATRNVEQINAFDSRCDHQHPSCKSSLWSVSRSEEHTSELQSRQYLVC